MKTTKSLVLAGALLGLLASGARAQGLGAGSQQARSFELATLHQAAIDTDPRTQQFALLTRQTDLRLRNVATLRRPTVSVEGYGQYQSDVAHLPSTAGPFSALFSPPKDTYDASVRVDQRLFDATIDAQLSLERAQLVERQARVRTALFTLRQQVNDAFFAAAGLQARAGSLNTTIDDLTARLNETNARVQAVAAPIPLGLQFPIDWRLFVYTRLLALVAATIPALVPAWQVLRPDLAASVTAGGGSVGGRRQTTVRRTFVIMQTAGSTVFLAAALLFGQSWLKALSYAPGFDIDHTLVGPCPTAESSAVDEHYFLALRIHVLSGRTFAAGEPPEAVVVSEAAATQFWPGTSPLGRTFREGPDATRSPSGGRRP